MTSRSPGFSPAAASSSSARRSARSDSAADAAGVVGHVGRLVERRRPLLRPEDPQRLIPRHGVQPGTQPTRVTQSVEPGCGDDEGVLNGVGGVGRVAEQGSAVLEEGICVPVVGSGQPEGDRLPRWTRQPRCRACEYVSGACCRLWRERRHCRYTYFGCVRSGDRGLAAWCGSRRSVDPAGAAPACTGAGPRLNRPPPACGLSAGPGWSPLSLQPGGSLLAPVGPARDAALTPRLWRQAGLAARSSS